MQLNLSFLLCLLSAPVWFYLPGRLQADPLPVIRLDDQLSPGQVKASNASVSASVAEPIAWQNFFKTSDIKWQLIRGHVGVRNGDLVVNGGGSTPVLFSPQATLIDWSLYQAVEIRMSAQAGHEIKIKIGSFEAKKDLGPAGQYNIYRFDINFDEPKSNLVLGLMPTDSLDAAVAIHSIKLVPKPANFVGPFGRQSLGKNDEYRPALYLHSPSVLSFNLNVPAGAHLHFGMGSTVRNRPMRFHVAVDGGADVFNRSVARVDQWSDADIDLSRWGGKSVQLQLRADSGHEGDVALWTNPLVTASGKRTRPNVLIYTIDTVRADHTSAYGYSRDTTPFLKKLGASGVVFEDCQAQATWTKSSIASLMTSLYSFTHGIVGDSDTIPSGATTLASQLRSAGYTTASIIATPYVGRATGLERGFDMLLEAPLVERQVNARTDRSTDSAALNRVVFPWLDQHHNEPFFLYLHSTDPHAPYGPPPPYDGAFAKPAENAIFEESYGSFRDNHQHGGGDVISREMCKNAHINPDSFIRQAVDRYDGEILHNDHSLELLIGKLRQLGVLDNTLIIVLSDHGEEFWDHGWTAHGQSVYEELTHVMLMMWNPALLSKPQRVKEPVQLIDVMPTILDLLGLKTPPIVEGQSLVPLLRGQPFQRRGPVVSSRFALQKPDGLVPENLTDSFALMDDHWKFIYRNKAAKANIKKVELYDRTVDRADHHDVAAQHPQEIEAMTATLSQWIQAQNQIRAMVGRAGSTKLDQNTIKQLRSLGYLGGSSQ